jgi:general secretion pathway protein M
MKPRNIDTVILLSLLALAVAVAGLFGFYVQGIYRADEERLQTLEPRYARLAGLALEKEQLAAALAATRGAVSRHIYPASRDISQAGNDAQQRVRDIFSRAGLEVLSSQVLPSKSSGQFDRIPITVRIEGEYLALQTALASLPTLTPTLLVDGFNVQNVSVPNKPDAPIRLVVQLELFVLRGKS